MDEKQAIQFLKKQLGALPHLYKLRYDNREYPLWLDTTAGVVEKVFGKDSVEYQKMATSYRLTGNFSEVRQASYRKILRKRESDILSIIQIHETLGIGEKPAEKIEQKDKAQLPIQLFDAMEFHPRVVKASKSLFTNGHYAQAIFEAFKAVENFVKEKSGSTLYGKQLMATAFNEDKPIIQVPEAGHFDKDVQEGFKFLFMGGTLGIRNPKAHQEVIQKDPFITLEYLGFASFLIKRIDYWEAGST